MICLVGDFLISQAYLSVSLYYAYETSSATSMGATDKLDDLQYVYCWLYCNCGTWMAVAKFRGVPTSDDCYYGFRNLIVRTHFSGSGLDLPE